MAIGDDRPHKGRRFLVLVLLGIGIWLFVRGWSSGACPGQDEVLAAYVHDAGIAPEDVPENPLGLVELWADEQPGLEVRVGAWDFRAGLAPPTGGAKQIEIDPDARFALVFLKLGTMPEEYRRRYYVTAKPATPFAWMRLHFHELGGTARQPVMDRWGEWGGWDTPDD